MIHTVMMFTLFCIILRYFFRVVQNFLLMLLLFLILGWPSGSSFWINGRFCFANSQNWNEKREGVKARRNFIPLFSAILLQRFDQYMNHFILWWIPDNYGKIKNGIKVLFYFLVSLSTWTTENSWSFESSAKNLSYATLLDILALFV